MATVWLLTFPLSAASLADPGPVCPSAADGLRVRTDAVFQAWADQDRGEYERQRDLLFEELACVDELIDTEVAIRIHLVVSMDAYMARHEATARAALRSVASLQPDVVLGQIVPLPPDFNEWLEAGRGHTGSYESIRGRWAFDGVQTDQRPIDRPTIAQRLGPGGPDWTKLVPAGDPLPQNPAWAPAGDSNLRTPLRANPRIWWTATGTSAAVATGLWVATARAGAAHQANLDRYASAGPLPASSRPEVEATLHRANTLGRAAQGFTIATAGFGIVALTLKK